MIFKLITFLFAFTGANQDFYVWPEILVTTDKELLIHVFCFDVNKCMIAKTKCGTEAVPANLNGEFNLTSETGEYALLMLSIDSSHCSKGSTEVTFQIDETDQRLRFPSPSQIVTNIHEDYAILTDLCPTRSAFGYWLLPCFTSYTTTCETATVCDGIFSVGRPSQIGSKANDSYHTAKKSGKECKLIHVLHKQFECSKIQMQQDQSKVEHHAKICTILRAEFNGEKLIVEIPTKIGQHVCVDFDQGRHSKTGQQCTVASRRITEFSLSHKTRRIDVVCDGRTHRRFQKDDEDINCPMIFTHTTFAKLICKDAYRPVVFWVSMVWLITGLPCVWALMIFYYKYKCWAYMKKFWKKNSKCECCGDEIISKLDATNHESCCNNVCPHCCKVQYSSKELMKHVVKCEKRESSFEKTKEILNWEANGYRCKYDVNTIHKTRKFKIVWFALFVFVFFGSFIPTLGNDCSHVNRCIRQNRYGIDNSHVPPRDIYNAPHPPSINSGSRPVDRNGNGNQNGNEVNTDEIFKATSTVMDALMKVNTDVALKLKRLETNVVEEFKEKLNIVAEKIEELMNVKVEEEVCNKRLRVINFNQFLSPEMQQNAFNYIQVHSDSELSMMQLGQTVSEISNSNVRQVVPGNYAGPDAVVQQGRDYQHAQGGSGGRNQFGLGGSTNLDANKEPEFNPDATVHRSSSMGNKNNYDDLLLKFNSRSKRSLNSGGRRSLRHRIANRTSRKTEDQNIERMKRQSEIKIELDKSRLQMQKEANDFKNLAEKKKYSHILKVKEVSQKGQKHSIKEITISQAKPRTSKKDSQIPHEKWFDFHDIKGQVCEVNCLHEPSTCKCVESNVPLSGSYQLPWTTLQTTDVHMMNNPLSFKTATTSIDHEDYDNLFLKTNIEATMDLFEGSHVSWKLKNSKSNSDPVISVVIPRISQVYHSSFLYYTCERVFETEVKGYCTGACGDYCGGKVCIGSRIWKWENCRKLSCNPSWCWATADGCCCCGSNVVCPNSGKIGSVWSMEYLRTEFLLCVFYNDRLQNCRLVDSTQTLDFGMFTIGVTRVLDAGKRLSRHIFAVHESRSDDLFKSKIQVWGHPSEIYLDPPVCVGEQMCNHGYIGDVQVEDAMCLPKLGTFCQHQMSELSASNCTDRVFVSHANTDMHMTCHFAHQHSCNHEGVVRDMKFDDRLKQTEKLEDHFYIKKLLMDFKKQSMLLYPLPKEDVGTIQLSIEGTGILVPKRDKKPVIENLMISECKGCYLCKSGFYCTLSVDLITPDNTLVTLKSQTKLIDFNLSPVSIKRGNNNLRIWGIAYGDTKTMHGCLMFGSECLKTMAATIQLDKPVGQFVPQFETITGEGKEEYSCVGWAWFTCMARSIKEFFSDIWENIWEFLVILAAIMVLLILIFFLPQIFTMVSAVCKVCCKGGVSNRAYKKGKHVNDIYRDLNEKRKKYENKKKTDDDDLELEELLIQKEDVDFTSA